MQSLAARHEADLRLLGLQNRWLTLSVLLGAILTVIAVIWFLFAGYYLTSDTGRRALSIDLRVFWAAARLMLAGEPLAAFDMSRLAAEHGENPGEWMPS